MARGSEQLLAFISGVVDRAQRQRVRAAEQIIGIAQARRRPFCGGDHFGRANAAILVGVDQRKRFGVELQALRRTGECDPKFLVQLIQRLQVSARFEAHLVKATGAKEGPSVRLLRFHNPGSGSSRMLTVR